MLIVTTGISGTGRAHYCKRLETYTALRDKKIKIKTPGNMLFAEAKARGIRVTQENVLNLHRDTLHALLGIVFEKILSEIPQLLHEGYTIIINLHGTFFWNDQYIPALNFNFLQKFNPDMYVNFIANSDVIVRTLKSNPQWCNLFSDDKAKTYALEKIMEWQSVEVLATKIAAQFDAKPFFIIPSGGTESILYRLIFEPWRKKFYLGMPLTFLHGSEHAKSRERINLFAQWLEEYVILIDPRYVEPLGATQLTSAHENKTVHHHVVGRDLNWLIPECDGMVGFYPEAVPSYGENCERLEVHRTNGKTFLIYPSTKLLSPFFTEWADEIFASEEEFKPRFLAYLGNEYVRKVEDATMMGKGEENGTSYMR